MMYLILTVPSVYYGADPVLGLDIQFIDALTACSVASVILAIITRKMEKKKKGIGQLAESATK